MPDSNPGSTPSGSNRTPATQYTDTRSAPTCRPGGSTIRHDDETTIVGGTHDKLHYEDLIRTVADLLLDGSTPHVEISITPEPGVDNPTYQLQWQYVTYNHETETWIPVTEEPTTSLLGRLHGCIRRISTWTQPIVRYGMPAFDVDTEDINVFEVNDTYLFKHYFDNSEVFDELRRYYNQDAYRFELPDHETLQQVDELLADHFYTLNHVDDHEPYCVVMDRGEDYSDILRNAVVRFNQGQHTVFLMKDQLSVDHAIEQGAVPLEDSVVSL